MIMAIIKSSDKTTRNEFDRLHNREYDLRRDKEGTIFSLNVKITRSEEKSLVFPPADRL